METFLHSMPMLYTPKPSCLNQSGTALTLPLCSSCSCACACAVPVAIPVTGWLLLLTLTLAILLLAERDMVANMPCRLSQHSPLSLQPVYTMTGRGPFQGYYSPCSECHYCLRGMDHCVDGASAIRRHLHALGERAVRLGWLWLGWDGLPCVGWGWIAMGWDGHDSPRPWGHCSPYLL